MDLVKKLSELIPFLQPYPIWIKLLVGTWTILSAVLLIALVFGRPPTSTNRRLLHGYVRTAAHVPVPAATVEVLTPSGRTDTTSDSEGRFHIDARKIDSDGAIRIRVAATGHRPYERELELRDDTIDLGEFTLQPDRVEQLISRDQTDALVTSLQSARLQGLPGNPTREDVCEYLDSVASDADALAAVWRDILQDVNSGRALNATRIEELRSKYQVKPMPNAPYFFRLTSFLSYLKEVSSVRVAPPWATEVAIQVGQLLYQRDVSAESLKRYLTSITASIKASDSAAADLNALSKSIENVQATAANLHAIAKTARAVGSVSEATRT